MFIHCVAQHSQKIRIHVVLPSKKQYELNYVFSLYSFPLTRAGKCDEIFFRTWPRGFIKNLMTECRTLSNLTFIVITTDTLFLVVSKKCIHLFDFLSFATIQSLNIPSYVLSRNKISLVVNLCFF